MTFKAETATESSNPSSHHGSDLVSGVANEEISSYSSNAHDEYVSLEPKWKDDGDDDSTCESFGDVENYEIHRIPSTLEFVSPCGDEQPHASPSCLSYSHHSSRVLEIEMIEDGLLPPLIASFLSGPRLEDKHTKIDSLATDTTCTKERNSFRRRLHSSTDFGSIGTNPLSESQSLSQSLPSSAPSRSTPFSRNRQRLVLMFGAFLLVMLSTHENNIKNSREYYRQLDYLSRQEIAFPLGQEEENSAARGTADGVAQMGQENHNYQRQKAELPKFYFPKADAGNSNRIRGAASAGRQGSNLVMARPHQPRPVFVPDTPLPDGGFKKPLERFVYDSQRREQIIEQQRRNPHAEDSSTSWTSWIARLALVSIMFDSSRKEFRRYRLASISSSRDE